MIEVEWQWERLCQTYYPVWLIGQNDCRTAFGYGEKTLTRYHKESALVLVIEFEVGAMAREQGVEVSAREWCDGVVETDLAVGH